MSEKDTKKEDNGIEPVPLSTSVRKKLPSKRKAEINKLFQDLKKI
jgi:hypothetical protein